MHVHPTKCENHLSNVFLALPAMDVWLQVDVCDIMDEVVGFAPVEAEDCLKGPGGSRFSEYVPRLSSCLLRSTCAHIGAREAATVVFPARHRLGACCSAKPGRFFVRK